MRGEYKKKMFQLFEQKKIPIFFLTVQIYMKDAEKPGLFPIQGYADNPRPVRSGGNFMKGAECAERNGKNNNKNSPIFVFRVIIENWGDFFHKNDT